MAKRIADKELTDRNWDQEEEGEEAGTFSVASEDVMKNRNIKKAKRRNTGAEVDSGAAFRGFKGFSLSSSSAGAAVPPPVVSSSLTGFQSLSALTNGSSSSFGGFSAPPTTTSSTGLVFNGSSSADVKPVNGSATPSTGDVASGGSVTCGGSSQYRVQLTALNVCVRDWISKHVTDNPLCDLQPIFRDYEKHLASIEKSYALSSSSPPAAPAPSSSLFSFTQTQDHSSSSPRPAGVSFNFGQKVDSSLITSLSSASTTPSFSFSSTTSSSSLFGGVTAPPTTFNQPKTEETQPADENGGEDCEEPPKPDVKEVKEDDAFYSQKCKLFYKKEAEFKEKGVGTLHLKETKDGKTQMIIRADTNLGNILLNVLLQASLPCSRLGKNNVMVVCVPNPPLDDSKPSSPVPLLIRVKTAEDADTLLKTLEERKT